MATQLPTLQERLTEAQNAYHKLATGTQVVTARDSNGESLTYTPASAGVLKQYIQELQDEINTPTGRNPCDVPGLSPRASGPMRIWF